MQKLCAWHKNWEGDKRHPMLFADGGSVQVAALHISVGSGSRASTTPSVQQDVPPLGRRNSEVKCGRPPMESRQAFGSVPRRQHTHTGMDRVSIQHRITAGTPRILVRIRDVQPSAKFRHDKISLSAIGKRKDILDYHSAIHPRPEVAIHGWWLAGSMY